MSIDEVEKVIQLNQKQISYIASLLLMLSFFIFIAGYYWGKRSSIFSMNDQRSAQALADKIYYAFYAPDEKIDSLEMQESSNCYSEFPQEISPTFMSLRSAQDCLKRIGDLGHEGNAHIKEHISTTAKGTMKNWYQVVSGSIRDE